MSEPVGREGEGGVVGGAAIWLSSNIDLLCLHPHFFRIDRHNISIEKLGHKHFRRVSPLFQFSVHDDAKNCFVTRLI